MLIPLQKAKRRAQQQLESSVALFRGAREQTHIPRLGSAAVVRSRELVVLAAEAALTNGDYEMARAEVSIIF